MQDVWLTRVHFRLWHFSEVVDPTCNVRTWGKIRSCQRSDEAMV
jgi:hypothetical protein